MSSCSNLVILLHSLPTSTRSWTACLLAIPLQPHWQMSQQHHAPVQGMALSLWGQHHLLQQGTASSEIHSAVSSFHVNGQVAPHNHTEVWQDQAGLAQTQAHNSTLSHSVRPFFPSDFLTWFPVSLDAPAKGQHLAPNQQQHPQATISVGLSGTPQHNPLDGPLYSNIRPGLVTLPAMGPLPGISQTTTNVTSMDTNTATMAKVIPNVPLKLQQRIIQVEFIDLSELLQVDVQFKYASIDSNNAFELVHQRWDHTHVAYKEMQADWLPEYVAFGLGLVWASHGLYLPTEVLWASFLQKLYHATRQKNSSGPQSRCMTLGSVQCAPTTAAPSPPQTKPWWQLFLMQLLLRPQPTNAFNAGALTIW